MSDTTTLKPHAQITVYGVAHCTRGLILDITGDDEPQRIVIALTNAEAWEVYEAIEVALWHKARAERTEP